MLGAAGLLALAAGLVLVTFGRGTDDVAAQGGPCGTAHDGLGTGGAVTFLGHCRELAGSRRGCSPADLEASGALNRAAAAWFAAAPAGRTALRKTARHVDSLRAPLA
ncbi:MAG: hypothetical protein U5Q44_07950 [Dehalococcoidia bacterium]|nr:hypothetical protein [Dehalococcoidia bacterium]